MRLRSASAYIIGARSNYEDACAARDDLLLFAVADGMGGAPAGEVASKMAIEEMTRAAENGARSLPDMREAVDRAHLSILGAARGSREREGMGTTLTVGRVVAGELLLLHVGDSAAFLLREGAVKKLTTSHASAGGLDNALGVGLHAYRGADSLAMMLWPRDVLVFCSDGLTDVASAREIGTIAYYGSPTPRGVAERLIGHARSKRAQDNVTVVAVRVED